MINWGLVGCGDISAKRVAPAIMSEPGSTLFAVMSPFDKELGDFAERFGIKKKYSNMEKMLLNKEINAIYVATPVFTHYSIALEALNAGKHVLLEKPMAMTNAQCEGLIRAAQESDVKLGIAYYRRFFPKLNEVKRLIKERIIGDVIQVSILYHSWRSETASWRISKAQAGGGPLWDMGCHKFDLLIDLVGMPKSVFAYMSTLTHEYEVEDSCSSVLELENGAHCLASFNWNSKVWADEFEILGTEGKIVMAPCDSDSLELHLNPRLLKGMGKEITRVSIPNHSNVHYPLIEDFTKAIIENKQPEVTGEEGYKTNKILAAIEESAKSGRKFEI